MRRAFLRTRMLMPTACAVAALSVVLTGQDPPKQPAFRSGASTVAVYTTVTDSTGRLVPDLTKDDFEIYDNGKLQPITLFATETQPLSVVVMLDRSGSMKESFNLVALGAEEFVKRLLPADKARIGSFATKIQVDPEEFTSDRKTLIDILRSEMQPDGPTPLWNAANVAIRELLPQDGRKVVLLFTDGVDSPMNFKTNNLSVMDVMERATKEDVMLYAIGLESRMPFGRRQAPLGGGGLSGGFGGQSGGGMTQRPDPGPAEDCRRDRRRLFRIDESRRSEGDVCASGRRAAPAVHARVRADQARRQDPRSRSQTEDTGHEGAGAQELPRGEAADVLTDDQSSSPATRRPCLVPARRFFASRRFSFDAPDGRVLRRRFGLTAALRSISTSRSRAASRFCACVRNVRASITSMPSIVMREPASARKRSRTSSSIDRGSAGVEPQLHRRRYFVDVLPAGPRRAHERLLDLGIEDDDGRRDLEHGGRLGTAQVAARLRERSRRSYLSLVPSSESL